MNLQYSQYQQFFKTILVGDTGTGKTNLIKTYESGIKPQHVNPTVGVDFYSKVVDVGNNRKVKLQIWDTAGQQQYRSITMGHYKSAMGALVVFDVTNRNTFNSVSRWISDVRERCNENVVVGIIGHKIDSDRRVIGRQQGENLASRQHAFYMETTVYDVKTINNAFERLAQEINRSGKTRNLQFSRTNLQLGSNNPTKKQNSCPC